MVCASCSCVIQEDVGITIIFRGEYGLRSIRRLVELIVINSELECYYIRSRLVKFFYLCSLLS